MTEVRRTFTVTPPPERLRAYLRDFANAEQWDPGTKSCTKVSSGEIGIGTTWRNVSEFRGKETELTYRLTEDEPNKVVLVGENKTVTSTDTITLTPVPSGGTEVDYLADFDFHGLANLAVPFIKGNLDELGDKTQEQMIEVLNKL